MSAYLGPDQAAAELAALNAAYGDGYADEMAALNAGLGASGDTYDLSALDPDLQAELDAAEAGLAAAGYVLTDLPLDQPLPDLGAIGAQRQAEDAAGMPWDTEERTAYLLSRVERGTYLPPAPAGEDASGCGAHDDLGYCTARYHDAGCMSVLSAEAANGSAESALAWRQQLLSNHGAASALHLANEQLAAQAEAQAASGVRSSAAYREMRGLLGLG